METDDAVRRMFDLSDLPKELLDKKQRMEKMRELGAAVIRSREDWSGIDPNELWRLLGGSPLYDVAEKQHMVEGLPGLSPEQLDELHGRLKDGWLRVQNYCYWDLNAPTLLYATIQNGEMADALDWESALAATGKGGLLTWQ